MKKIIILLVLFFVLTGCVSQNIDSTTKQKIDNIGTITQTTTNESCLHRGCEPEIQDNECSSLGGEVITTQSGYCVKKEDFLGTVVGVLCPCICCKK